MYRYILSIKYISSILYYSGQKVSKMYTHDFLTIVLSATQSPHVLGSIIFICCVHSYIYSTGNLDSVIRHY
jgi:hypothetical protein